MLLKVLLSKIYSDQSKLLVDDNGIMQQMWTKSEENTYRFTSKTAINCDFGETLFITT